MQKLFSEKEDGYIREQMDLLESICEANDIKFSELGNYGEALLTTPLEYWKVRLPNNSTNPYKQVWEWNGSIQYYRPLQD